MAMRAHEHDGDEPPQQHTTNKNNSQQIQNKAQFHCCVCAILATTSRLLHDLGLHSERHEAQASGEDVHAHFELLQGGQRRQALLQGRPGTARPRPAPAHARGADQLRAV